MFSRFRRLSLRRSLALVLPAAVLAFAVGVAPSFGGPSFLTSQKAERLYLSKKTASDTFLKKKHAPVVPWAQTAGSTANFAPVSSTTQVTVPGSTIPIDVPDTTLLTLTFSGTSTCTADTADQVCPVKLLVDGQPASTGTVKFDASGTSQPLVHTVTQTSIVLAGAHTISVAYAGVPTASPAPPDQHVAFGLKSWDLVVEGYPNT